MCLLMEVHCALPASEKKNNTMGAVLFFKSFFYFFGDVGNFQPGWFLLWSVQVPMGTWVGGWVFVTPSRKEKKVEGSFCLSHARTHARTAPSLQLLFGCFGGVVVEVDRQRLSYCYLPGDYYCSSSFTIRTLLDFRNRTGVWE